MGGGLWSRGGKKRQTRLDIARRTEGQRDLDFLLILLSTHMPVLSTCPLHTDSGCGKERRILINWSIETCQGSTRSELP